MLFLKAPYRFPIFYMEYVLFITLKTVQTKNQYNFKTNKTGFLGKIKGIYPKLFDKSLFWAYIVPGDFVLLSQF